MSLLNMELLNSGVHERTAELINIAHPKFRDELTEYAKETFNVNL